MSVFNQGSFTFSGEIARQGIMEPFFNKPEMRNLFDVRQDLKAKEQIAFVGRLTKISLKDSGVGSTPSGSTTPITDQFWDPQKIEAWVAQSAYDLEKTFLVWGLQAGYSREHLDQAKAGDGNENLIYEFLMTLMADATYEDYLRFIFLGDTAIVAGALSAGATDVPNYNQIDGIWKKVFANVTATTTFRHTIAENALSTAAAQAALGATVAYDTMRDLYENADPRLSSDPDVRFIVTKSIYDNYLAYREAKTGVSEAFIELTGGVKAPAFRGIPIIKVDLMDRYIRADFKPAAVYDKPHRVLMATPKNIVVGFDGDESSITAFEYYFDWIKKQGNVRGNYLTDVKIMFPFLTAAAY